MLSQAFLVTCLGVYTASETELSDFTPFFYSSQLKRIEKERERENPCKLIGKAREKRGGRGLCTSHDHKYMHS